MCTLIIYFSSIFPRPAKMYFRTVEAFKGHVAQQTFFFFFLRKKLTLRTTLTCRAHPQMKMLRAKEVNIRF